MGIGWGELCEVEGGKKRGGNRWRECEAVVRGKRRRQRNVLLRPMREMEEILVQTRHMERRRHHRSRRRPRRHHFAMGRTCGVVDGGAEGAYRRDAGHCVLAVVGHRDRA